MRFLGRGYFYVIFSYWGLSLFPKISEKVKAISSGAISALIIFVGESGPYHAVNRHIMHGMFAANTPDVLDMPAGFIGVAAYALIHKYLRNKARLDDLFERDYRKQYTS